MADERAAELMRELLGAQMIAKTLQEVWEVMTPEMKVRIAEAVCAAAIKEVNGSGWTIRSVVETEVQRHASALLTSEGYPEMLRKRAVEEYERVVDSAVKRVVDRCITETLAEVKVRIGR